MENFVKIILQNRAVISFLTLVLIAVGLLAFKKLPIEAYPNPIPPMIEVIIQPHGWSAEEVERYVTIPTEIGLAGMPGLTNIRSQSLFGLADIKCYFNWHTTYAKARQEVLNRLQFITLPDGLQASLSPWNAIGEVYRYTLVGDNYSLIDLKTTADWLLEREFKQVPGIADVVTFGGKTKEYHVEIDPFKLKSHNVTLAELNNAIANANQNTGGERLTIGEQSYTIRGIGLIKSLQDIENIVITEQNGVPLKLRDLATVNIGFAPRLGIVGHDHEPDVVQGTVLMRYGEETAKTLKGVHDKVKYIEENELLPVGMRLEPYYDRGHLVALTTHTVMENLLIGMLLVTAVLLVFLGNFKAALLTALNIPLALLFAFCGMVLSHTPANLISLGAVDFGIVVDSTVIIMENIFRHLSASPKPFNKNALFTSIHNAAKEVGRPMLFSTSIIAIAFLPLFTMTGVSGVIFAPMAKTYALAIGGAILFSLTITPVLVSYVLTKEKDVTHKETKVMLLLQRLYNPIFTRVLKSTKLTLLLALSPIACCVLLFPLLGTEFMPKLEEGNLWIRGTLPVSISLEESSKHVNRFREIVLKYPEVAAANSQLGRPDDGTDVAGFHNMEVFAPLKPRSKWRKGMTKDKLTDELTKDLSTAFPGVSFNFSQYLSDNVDEALSGVKGENSIKISSPSIENNTHLSEQIIEILKGVPGIQDLGFYRSMGQPSIKISPDRDLCTQYGLNTRDIVMTIQAAIGGETITQVYEGEKNFALTVRFKPEYRDNLAAINKIPIAAKDGSQIPLGQLAKITKEDSPSVIYRENGHRYSPIKFSVRNRDLGSTIKEAKELIQERISLPRDTHIEWSGQFGELKEAMTRLSVIIPITLILIGFLVYNAVKNWIDTTVVLLSIPVACSGGVLALLLTKENFSVSAAMGFVSIFGIAIQAGILMVTYAQRQWSMGLSLEEGAQKAAAKRFRPVLMTSLVATLGLLPAALSNEIGAQTQKPLAIVVIGGSLTLALLIQILVPALLVLLHKTFPKTLSRQEIVS